MLIKSSSGFRKATSSTHLMPRFDSVHFFWILLLSCARSRHAANFITFATFFCLRFDDEIIGCRHRSSREWRKNNEINMWAWSEIIKCTFFRHEGYRELDNQVWKNIAKYSKLFLIKNRWKVGKDIFKVSLNYFSKNCIIFFKSIVYRKFLKNFNAHLKGFQIIIIKLYEAQMQKHKIV